MIHTLFYKLTPQRLHDATDQQWPNHPVDLSQSDEQRNDTQTFSFLLFAILLSIWDPTYSMYDEYQKQSRVQQAPTNTIPEQKNSFRYQDDPISFRRALRTRKEAWRMSNLVNGLLYRTLRAPFCRLRCGELGWRQL